MPPFFRTERDQFIPCLFTPLILLAFLFVPTSPVGSAEPPEDRFVWVFGYSLGSDEDLAKIFDIMETGADHGLNGAVLSAGLDTLCIQPESNLKRLAKIRQFCEEKQIELIPAVFSVGYGGAVLSHNRHLAAGMPVRNAPFLAGNEEAELLPDPELTIPNGGFESYEGHRAAECRFHDDPGEISFIDTEIVHGGEASLRFENMGSNPHGHGRVMQEIPVRPNRCYRIHLWVKTDRLSPPSAFKMQVLAEDRSLCPQSFDIPATGDWRKITMLFNSLDYDQVRIYAGTWKAQTGRFWIDDWSIEEVGPINVLHRPGTPVTVTSDDGSVTYREGRDYAPLVDPNYNPRRVDREAVPLKLLPDSRIREGERLRVSWYHSLAINGSQITVCMAEPELYEIFDHEAALLAKHLAPKRVMLNMDEIRMGGTCAACDVRDMAELLGECIRKQVAILRKHMPGVEVYIWSDMLDPHHNARDNYFLVDGDFTGSWEHVPEDLILMVWGGPPRPESLRFCAEEQGFDTTVACYYGADDLKDVKAWIELAETIPNVRGFMYTPWSREYGLVAEFGEMIQKADLGKTEER